MLYKRTEYFRYTFDQPLNAKFRILATAGSAKESRLGECLLIDLSPGGAKLFIKFNLPSERYSIRMHIEFTLFDIPIDVYGQVVWKKPFRGAYLYGLDFEEDLRKAQLIVSELKLLRKKEVEEKKKRN